MRRRRVLVIGRAWGYYGIAIVWRIDPSHVTSTSLLVFVMTVIVVSRVHLIARKGWMGETLLVGMVCRIRSREMGHVVVMLWGWNLFWKMRWSWTSTARNGWNWARWRLAVPMWNRAFRLPHYAIVLWVGTNRQPQSLMIIIIRDLQVLHCMKERRGLAMTLVISKLILVVLRLLLKIQLRLHWAIGTWNMHLWTVDVMSSCRVAEEDPVAQIMECFPQYISTEFSIRSMRRTVFTNN